MATRVALVALMTIALLAAASPAEAKGKPEKVAEGQPPDHAKAHGLTKRDEPAPPPAAEPPAAASPAPQPETPATAPAPAPVAETPPAHPAVAPAAPATQAFAALVLDAPAAAPAQTESAPDEAAARDATRREARDETRADALFAGATLAARTPQRAAPAADAAADDAPWWAALAWSTPLLGLGGVATVVLLRRRAPAVPQGPAMAPVSPVDLKGLLANGHAAAARGAYLDAVAWFDRALALMPQLAVASFCKGVCLAASGRMADAYGALQEACDLEPTDASYRVHFARAAAALGKHHDAMDALAMVAREAPELGAAMLDDPQLAGLRDHPRFLMMCGAL